MRIINVGSCNIDHVYGVDHVAKPGETLGTASYDVFPGGKGLNQSIAAAKAGAKVFHAGLIGADGEILRRVLQENGVDTGYLKTVDGNTGSAIIQVTPQGENCIILHRGTNGSFTAEYVDSALSDFGRDDVLLLQNEINLVSPVIDRAYERGMKIVFNPAPFTDALTEIDYSKLYCLVLNEIEAQGLGKKPLPMENLKAIAERYPTLITVVTLGGKGCIYYSGDEFFAYPAYEVEVVDSTAAGDTFIGYFVASISRGESTAEAIKMATAASAIAVSRKGAAVSVPLLDEVESAMESLRFNDVSDRREYVRRTIDVYIGNNLQDVTLTKLAAEVGYSETYVSELVKKVYGVCFSQLLQEKRCSRAAVLLTQTDKPVSEIIFSVGYENESFFRLMFKKRYGCSPQQYRTRHKK